jgi:hypothetical protein
MRFEQRAAELKAGLATVGNMRPGSLVERIGDAGSQAVGVPSQEIPAMDQAGL